MNIIAMLRQRAKAVKGTVVLPEAFDKRTLIAAAELIRDDICKVILLGNPVETKALAASESIDLGGVEIVDPADFPQKADFIETLYERRKTKGMTHEEATAKMNDILYIGTMMVKKGMANGMVAGAANTTADVLRAALHVVGVQAGLKTVSSAFIMAAEDFMGHPRVFLFSDCAVVPNPTAEQLADIAISTAATMHKIVGEEPKVALLSFSTKGSAKDPLVDKVIEAKAILDERKPGFSYDGELQADAAIIPAIGSKKAPGSAVAGNANVLIFPDLQAGNIGYKLTQRFGGVEAIGPVIQGLAAPVCDLSRGCSAEDISNTACLTLLMSV